MLCVFVYLCVFDMLTCLECPIGPASTEPPTFFLMRPLKRHIHTHTHTHTLTLNAIILNDNFQVEANDVKLANPSFEQLPPGNKWSLL